MKKLDWKSWGYLGFVFLIIGIFNPIFLNGLFICWFIMSYKYYKEKKSKK